MEPELNLSPYKTHVTNPKLTSNRIPQDRDPFLKNQYVLATNGTAYVNKAKMDVIEETEEWNGGKPLKLAMRKIFEELWRDKTFVRKKHLIRAYLYIEVKVLHQHYVQA